MAKRKSYLDTPGYMAFIGVVAFWAAASSGSDSYVRVLAGACAAFALVRLGIQLVGRRRRRRAAAVAGGS
ncbi:hypothetical protein EES46_00785 [Streptomyces sp. ADI98-10]|uniref:hypothetical protein n=2 Tax=Streptomyces TaxID=1883 RepID=UPI00053AECF4|nr:hypothetical protein [Streptomyces anulatus]RPK94581.1 hypothetical protein EES46_00785 [Streptomyces sp. ADI98-10]